MTTTRRRIPQGLSLLFAISLLFTSMVPVALAGAASGDKDCLPGKSVRIWSRAGTELWHLWTNAGDYWPNNVNHTYRESLTGQQGTWWTVSWSVSSLGQGANCIQFG